MRCRNLRNDLFQNFFNIQSCLGRNSRCIVCLKSDHILNLVDNALRICTWEIDLVNDRKHIQVMIQCQINIRQRLRLDTLCCIYDQNRPITGSKTSGNLIVKIDMPWCIDQVKNIFFSIISLINDSYSLRLDRDTSLSLKLHIIQHLRLHLTFCQCTRLLNNTVSQSGLAMVYMCNNAEITNFALVYHSAKFLLMYFSLFSKKLFLIYKV